MESVSNIKKRSRDQSALLFDDIERTHPDTSLVLDEQQEQPCPKRQKLDDTDADDQAFLNALSLIDLPKSANISASNTTSIQSSTTTHPNKAREFIISGIIDNDTDNDELINNAFDMYSVNEQPPQMVKGIDEKDIPTDLNGEQACIWRTMLHGENVFITGEAGTGKSYLASKMIQQRQLCLGRHAVAVVAPTAAAAVNISGWTIHRFFGLFKGSERMNIGILCASLFTNKKVKSRLSDLRCLFIDEVSMLGPKLFMQIDGILRAFKREPNKVFGGVQMILVGDFHQLPPVDPKTPAQILEEKRLAQLLAKKKKEMDALRDLGDDFYIDDDHEGGPKTGNSTTGSSPLSILQTPPAEIPIESMRFCFQLPLWKESMTNEYVLTHVYRQQGDLEFASILHRARVGKVTTEDIAKLNSRVINLRTNLINGKAVSQFSTQLYPYKKQVMDVNTRKLNALPGYQAVYHAVDNLVDKTYTTILDDMPADKTVALNVGAAVMLVRNMDIERRLYNGSRGIVIHFVKEKDCTQLVGDDKKAEQNPEEAQQVQVHTNATNATTNLSSSFNTEDVIYEKISLGPSHSGMNVLGTKVFPVVRFENGEEETMRPHTWSITEDDKEICTRTQLPLRLGWAITIHKAQGLTLQNVRLNIEKTFEPGQGYVGISRATALRGIELEGPVTPNSLRADPVVCTFYSNALTKRRLPNIYNGDAFSKNNHVYDDEDDGRYDNVDDEELLNDLL